jgi:4-hydroxy-tetrahydrodipicolinate synthase
MNQDGSVDYEGWRALLRSQIAAGINGLVPLGTTGENPTLDETEEDKIIDIAIAEAKGRTPLVIGTGSNDTRHTVQYTKRAKDAGADAALVVVPYYNKPNEEGLYRHFCAAAEVGLPVIIYNIPGRTGLSLSVPTIERLSKIPNVIGIKEASGNMSHMVDVVHRCVICRDKALGPFAVMSGDDALTLPLMAAGGAGIISVVSNLLHEDRFMVLADYESYIAKQAEVDARYRDQDSWTRSAILNVARSGYFSSDRSIRDYVTRIWHVRGL